MEEKKLSAITAATSVSDNDNFVGVRHVGSTYTDLLYPIAKLVDYLKTKFFAKATTSPTITPGAALGTGGTTDILSGNDNAMTVVVRPGTSPTTGTIATIIFGTSKAATPVIVWSPAGGNANGLSGNSQVFIIPIDSSTIRIISGSTPIDGANYNWSIICPEL